jgi:hypothetical protein
MCLFPVYIVVPLTDDGKHNLGGFGFMVSNATFNNISVISVVGLIGGEHLSTRRKPSTCRKSLTNFGKKNYEKIDA